MSNKRKVHYA